MTIASTNTTISVETLLNLYRIGFKLVPIAADGKTPNVQGLLTEEEQNSSIGESLSDGKAHPVNYIYTHPEFWTEERLTKEAWRFNIVLQPLVKLV